MNASAMLRSFCDAVEQHNGKALAELFTEDGVYHDVFYGAFKGRARIAELIDDWFYRTATDFRWDMHTPVSDGHTLYARYTFSYRSLLPEAKGARAMFEGVAIMTLRDGKIACYHEVANAATGFAQELTPCPISFCSFGSPSQRADAPEAIISVRHSCHSSSVFTRKGRLERSASLTEP